MARPRIMDRSASNGDLALIERSRIINEFTQRQLEKKAISRDHRGNLVLGMVGPPVACRSCGKSRWDDGTRCRNTVGETGLECGAYQRPRPTATVAVEWR